MGLLVPNVALPLVKHINYIWKHSKDGEGVATFAAYIIPLNAPFSKTYNFERAIL